MRQKLIDPQMAMGGGRRGLFFLLFLLWLTSIIVMPLYWQCKSGDSLGFLH